MSLAVQQSVVGNPAQALYSGLNVAREKPGEKALASQERFLKLLVAQLKNQDPLNPLDNAQMTSQMAQISAVEGIDRLNATLQMILAGNSENQALQAAALVGRGVLVPGSGLALSGGTAVGGIELDEPAERVSVLIEDANGIAVKTLELGGMAAGSHSFVWDGTTDGGASAADGAYRIVPSAWRGEAKVGARALELGVVSGVTRGGDGIVLNVGTLGDFAMADVRQIL
jgi:flagellar basal-body rod modification protein FlgD